MNEPNLILFLLNIAGAVALLIWVVRLVRTGFTVLSLSFISAEY